MKYTHNSTGPEFDLLRAKNSYNPAYMHSGDIAGLGLNDGDQIQLSSTHGSIPAIIEASDDVKPGVISMAHSWGGTPDPSAGVDGKVESMGSNTNRLINNRDQTEKYSAMPRLSTIPVKISRMS